MADMKKVYDDLIIINLYHIPTVGMNEKITAILPYRVLGTEKNP